MECHTISKNSLLVYRDSVYVYHKLSVVVWKCLVYPSQSFPRQHIIKTKQEGLLPADQTAAGLTGKRTLNPEAAAITCEVEA